MNSKCAGKCCAGAAAAIILPNIGGLLGGLVVCKCKEADAWYKGLKKPKCTPPDWVFTPTWIALYSSMGLASYLVWKAGGGCHGPARLPLMIYGGQLALNWAWTPIFFGMRKPKIAFYEIVALDAAAAATAYFFYQIDKRAGLIFIPYLMWLGMATHLNYAIQRDNADDSATITEIS